MPAKFQIGQRVKIARNLGERKGYGDGHYFYGHKLDDFPLKSVAKIKEVAIENAFQPYVRLNINNRDIFLYPDEVQLLRGIENDEIAKRLRGSFKHPLIELAETAPVYVVGDMVYTRLENNREVVEVGSLDSLDELVEQRTAELIDAVGREYAEEAKKDFKQDDLDRNLDTAQLIYKQVFPYLRADGYDSKISEALGIEKIPEIKKQETLEKKAEASAQLREIAGELYQRVEGLIDDINKEDEDAGIAYEDAEKQGNVRRSEKQKDLDNLLGDEIDKAVLDALLEEPKVKSEPYSGNSLLGKSVNLKNFAIVNEKIYYLREGNHGDLNIDGKGYRVVPLELIEGQEVFAERTKRDFEVGDKIRMNKGANEYEMAKEGSEGEILKVREDDRLWVNFTKVTGGDRHPCNMHVHKKYSDNLSMEKIRKEHANATDINEVQDRYYHEISKQSRMNALKEHLSVDKLTELLQDQNAELLAIRGKEEYSEGDFGFIKHEGRYYAYLWVPEFALKSNCSPGTYYYHKKMRIGQAVRSSNGRISHLDKPIAIDNNGHMYMHDYREDFIKICYGDHNIPTSGKDDGELIAKRLRSTRDMMLFGYREFPECYSEYRRNPIKLDDVEKKNLLVVTSRN